MFIQTLSLGVKMVFWGENQMDRKEKIHQLVPLHRISKTFFF